MSYRDPDGFMWFVIWGSGVSRYDGKRFLNFTTQDSDGVMWFGTEGGVSRYDGQEFKNFMTQDGLQHNRVSIKRKMG